VDGRPRVRAAIVDYGLGNLFSVAQACRKAGMEGLITASKRDLLSAHVVILPGVGAFGDAMGALERLDLAGALKDIASSGRPMMGICLGMQLMMSESHEFGRFKGLGIIEGPVVRLEEGRDPISRAKVPEVGWNRILQVGGGAADGRSEEKGWAGTPLEGLKEGEPMYFVHSYYPRPADPGVVLSETRYGDTTFCSSFLKGRVFATQFHPERSGRMGLRIYENLAAMISDEKGV
jgi:imidazole glycerol-phosphate synthase subunit HisH